MVVVALFAVCGFAQAQEVSNTIVINRESFRDINKDSLTGVDIDPIAKDPSRNACARVKIKFDRMTREQVNNLEVMFRSNTYLAKQRVADYFDNVLILEMTAKKDTRFYVKSPDFAHSTNQYGEYLTVTSLLYQQTSPHHAHGSLLLLQTHH